MYGSSLAFLLRIVLGRKRWLYLLGLLRTMTRSIQWLKSLNYLPALAMFTLALGASLFMPLAQRHDDHAIVTVVTRIGSTSYVTNTMTRLEYMKWKRNSSTVHQPADYYYQLLTNSLPR